MASIVLSAVGETVGVGIGGSVLGVSAGTIGSTVGAIAGNVIDNNILAGKSKLPHSYGPRLEDLAVQTSTYGKMIPHIYGKARVAGNIIWSRPIKETATTTTTSAGGKGGSSVSQSSTTYSYSVTMAIAICEGEIDEIVRAWADAKELDLNQDGYTIYYGSESQLPDAVIEGFEGIGNIPAYRGISYVVIEDFPLAAFGNRIPNFTFEVRRSVVQPEIGDNTLEEQINSVVLIPGSGEFVYDTKIQTKINGQDINGIFVQSGLEEEINHHTARDQANALLALNQLQKALPNLEYVAVVCGWFGTDMDIANCDILPGVEYQDANSKTSPDEWAVAGKNRATAHLISTDGNGSPNYGGTPSDASLVRLLQELQSRGLKVMFYPFLFMDTTGKPWRGRLTGDAADVSDFFNKTNGHNNFILHYANLTKDYVDAFVIGSEMVALNAITSGAGVYPAVAEFVSLAASVKAVVGSGVKVTYASDWSEYHHAVGGWYHLDPLWSSPNIDVVGIDAYFPLTDAPQSELGYDAELARAGWTSGEGYDWYYSDSSRTVKVNFGGPEYAWKNLDWWWRNNHTNPDSSVTAWVPESKPIWFTELGFPSVDGATNQPNVFYDPNSSENGFPYHSLGRVDYRAQRMGLVGSELQWDGSAMIERRFIWTWDARPYPYYPDLSQIWSDGDLWRYGHWLQGKLGISSLAAIISELCQLAGLGEEQIDVSQLSDQIEGFVLNKPQTVRSAIEQLQRGYFFDVVASGDKLKYVPRGNASVATIDEGELSNPSADENFSDNSDSDLLITRLQEVELPDRISVNYMDLLRNYQQGTQHASRSHGYSDAQNLLNLPIVMSSSNAQIIADTHLWNLWQERSSFRFALPIRYAYLEPADVITVNTANASHQMRITAITMQNDYVLDISAVAEDNLLYDRYIDMELGDTDASNQLANSELYIFELPAISSDEQSGSSYLRAAIAPTGGNWSGAALYRTDSSGGAYSQVAEAPLAAIMGSSVTALGGFSGGNVIDNENSVDVRLLGIEGLASIDELSLLNGANAALLGDELIQFQSATALGEQYYRLSGLLRGRLGTEHSISSHIAGERFVLLDFDRLVRLDYDSENIGRSFYYKAVTIGRTISSAAEQSHQYTGRAFLPYAPVHITGQRDGSGNLDISWVRRTRIGGAWRDLVEVPLSEAQEAYEIDIMDGANIIRTIAATTANAIYSAAEQNADFGGLQSSVTLRIYQLSETIGRGLVAEYVL